MNFLRLFLFSCVMLMLCSTATISVSAQEEEKPKFNLFNRNKKEADKPKVKRTVEGDLERRIIQAIQSAGDPEAKSESNRRAIWYYGGFFMGLAVVIVVLVGWQVWRRRRAEWALNDPMALVQELNFVHQLTEHEKQFMQELSERYALTSPLKLFVDPKYFLETLDSDSFVASRSSVQGLLSKLFDIYADTRDMSVLTDGNADTVVYPQEGTQA